MSNKKSDWAKIEKSREIRLWITQIFIPAVGAGIMVWSNPNARSYLTDKFAACKTWVSEKFRTIKTDE